MLIFGQQQDAETLQGPSLNYTASGLRDPFETYLPRKKTADLKSAKKDDSGEEVGTVKPFPTFSIQGIIWGGQFPQAIINNKIVKAGDVIEEAKIIGIEKDGVDFLFYGSEYKVSAPGYKYSVK